jgi:hypothetical protein
MNGTLTSPETAREDALTMPAVTEFSSPKAEPIAIPIARPKGRFVADVDDRQAEAAEKFKERITFGNPFRNLKWTGYGTRLSRDLDVNHRLAEAIDEARKVRNCA